MAKLKKLITYAYLREEADISLNVPDIELDHKLYKAQETLRMLMGDEFYQDYLGQYPAFTTASYTTLYPYLKQYLAWQANEFYVIRANFKNTPAGFRVHTEENSVVATDVQMATIIKDAKQTTQQYKNMLISFIEGHASDYPLYNVSCGTNKLSGNSFHISAVKNKHHSHDCGCGCRGVRTW